MERMAQVPRIQLVQREYLTVTVRQANPGVIPLVYLEVPLEHRGVLLEHQSDRAIEMRI